MGRKRRTGKLVVALNGRTVGSLTKAADGATRFEYDGEWISWENAFPVSLSMPVREEPFAGEDVMAYFENLLPENDRILSRIAARVGAKGTDAYSMLEAIGRDCVGALQFLPEDADPEPPGRPEGKPMTDSEIADLVRSLATAPLGMRAKDGAFRISLAGAQEKTALLQHDGQWMEPIGITPTTHILKPQIGMSRTEDGDVDMTDSVQNEHFCMVLCRELQLKVAKTSILDLPGGLLVLCIERFDRTTDDKGRLLRLPQEDMCQALGVGPEGKYESEGGPGIAACLDLLKSSDDADRDRREFMKAQIVFWLIGATDGHAKNFSLFLMPHGKFGMTPLYDILSTQWQFDRRQISRRWMRVAMAMGDKRRYRIEEIAPRHFEQTARRAGFSVATLHEVMKETTEALPDALRGARSGMDGAVPEAMMESIAGAAERRAEQIDRYLA